MPSEAKSRLDDRGGNADPGSEKWASLRLGSEFDALKKDGRKIAGPLFILLYVPGLFGDAGKYGIVCSRKFDKRAVYRNRARRLLRVAVRTLETSIQPAGILLIPRRKILSEKSPAVTEALAAALKTAGLLRQSGV